MNTKTTRLWNWLKDSSALGKMAKICGVLAILSAILTFAAFAFLLVSLWPSFTQGHPLLLLELLDEMDDLIEMILGMAGFTALFLFGSLFLRSKIPHRMERPDREAADSEITPLLPQEKTS